MTSPADHADVAAYLLGALDKTDNAAFERHLAGCHRCQTELDELSGLPALLDQVRGSGLLADLAGTDDLTGLGGAKGLADFRPAPPSRQDEVLRGAMADIAGARRKRRRTGLLAAAAAAVLIIAGPLVTIAVIGGSSGSSSQPQAEVVQASNPADNVSATVRLTAQDYGTDVSFDLSGVKGPLNCTLYAVSKENQRYAVSSWLVSDTGYGVIGSPGPLRVSGTAAIRRSDLARLEFATTGGPDILDVQL